MLTDTEGTRVSEKPEVVGIIVMLDVKTYRKQACVALVGSTS